MSFNKAIILGFPRSGTTWFANIFNSHPDVIYRHEFLGREYKQLEKGLYNKLKQNELITDAELEACYHQFMKPQVNTDKPPFFDKNHLAFGNVIIHQYSWVLTKYFSPITYLYQYLFYPKVSNKTWLLLKETRSSLHMEAIIRNLKFDKTICLVRNPLAVIASFKQGYEKGVMTLDTDKMKQNWFENNKRSLQSVNQHLSKKNVIEISQAEYLAYRWCVYYYDLLEIAETSLYSKMTFISYDILLDNTEKYLPLLMKQLGLTVVTSSKEFLAIKNDKNSKQPKDASNEFYSVLKTPIKNKHKQILSKIEVKAIACITDALEEKLKQKYLF